MALPNTGITTNLVKVEIGSSSNNVGQLCTHSNINPWSTYKPINVPSVVLNDATRGYVSGFKISERVLYYDKPTGGAMSPYRLGDFRGYNHVARRPSNVIQNEFVSEEQNGSGLGTGYGKSSNSLVIRVSVPNTEVIHKWATEMAIMADTVTLTDTNDITLPGSFSDGMARASLASLSETNYYLNVPITIDLSSNLAGSVVNKTYKIWYGDSNDYKKFQIPEGSTVTLSIKILNVGVDVTASYDPLDNFPPLNIDSTTLYNGVYDSFYKRFTLTYLNIEGIKKVVQESPNNFYWSFENKIGWSLKYEITGNSGTKIPSTTVPTTMYYVADATGTPGRYYVRWSGSLIFDETNAPGRAGGIPGGIEDGDTIQFRMVPTSYYNPI